MKSSVSYPLVIIILKIYAVAFQRDKHFSKNYFQKLYCLSMAVSIHVADLYVKLRDKETDKPPQENESSHNVLIEPFIFRHSRKREYLYFST